MSVFAPAAGLGTATENARVQWRRVEDAEWTELPGVSEVTLNPGEAPSRDNVTYQKTTQFTGLPGPGTVDIDCPALVVAHSSYPTLRKAWKEGEDVMFRWQYEDRLLIKRTMGREVSIDNAGAVTFNAGANIVHPKWGIGNIILGAVIRTGASPDYVYTNVESYTAAGLPTCAPADPEIVDEEYDVVGPPVFQPEFIARIRIWGGIRGASQSELGSSLMIAPYDVTPDFEVGRVI